MKILKSKFTLLKNRLKPTQLVLAAMVLFCLAAINSNVHANPYDKVMQAIDEEFNRGDSKHRLAIIFKRMNMEYFDQLKEDDKIDDIALHSGVNRFNGTNAIALAICFGDVQRIAKYLQVIENPNDPSLHVWGHRQFFNLVHLALDPSYRWGDKNRKHIFSTENRLKIIDLLGATKIDFNFIPVGDHIGICTNPPLSAGMPSGRATTDKEKLQARALLYGADPMVVGSSFMMDDENSISQITKLAFSMVLNKEITRENIHPTENVKQRLEKLRIEHIEYLTNLTF